MIVGAAGPETTALHELVNRLSLQQHVVFLSELRDVELCWLYRRCELMIVPSSIEGFCFPLAEALRCGSRVLCSDIPILREIGESSCDYFHLRPGDAAAALTSAIEAALRKPAPLPHISDRFCADEIASQYLALYSTLANGHQAALSPQLCHESAP